MTQTQRIFADRVFAGDAGEGTKGLMWYCLTRENMLGPYASEELARTALSEFISWCMSVGATGERGLAEDNVNWAADLSRAA